MNINSIKIIIGLLIVIAVTSYVVANVTLYISDHNEMRETINDQTQLLQIFEETAGVHKTNAELLQDEVKDLKLVPTR